MDYFGLFWGIKKGPDFPGPEYNLLLRLEAAWRSASALPEVVTAHLLARISLCSAPEREMTV